VNLLLALLLLPVWADEYSPDQYVRRVLEKSPEVRQAELAAGVARSRHAQEVATAAMPALTLTGQGYPYGHNPFDSYRFNHWRLVRGKDVHADASVNWNFFRSFQDYEKVRSSSLARAASESALAAVRQERAFDAIQGFYELNSRQQLLEVARQNLAAQEDQYHKTQDLYRNGMKSLSDMLKGETDWRSSELRFIQAQANFKSSLMQFNLLIDHPAQEAAALKADLEPGATDLPLLSEDLGRALEKRPEMSRARQELARARVSYEQAIQGVLPTLSVDGTWNRSLLGGTSLPNPNYYLGVSLSLPVNFNLVTQYFSVRAARQQRESAEQSLAEVRRRVERETHTAYINLERATLAYRIAKQKEEISARNLALVTDQYRQSAADAIRLAQAQLDDLNARIERTEALNDIFINRARYKLAVGDPLW
jgi:outer membrane protein TolC